MHFHARNSLGSSGAKFLLRHKYRLSTDQERKPNAVRVLGGSMACWPRFLHLETGCPTSASLAEVVLQAWLQEQLSALKQQRAELRKAGALGSCSVLRARFEAIQKNQKEGKLARKRKACLLRARLFVVNASWWGGARQAARQLSGEDFEVAAGGLQVGSLLPAARLDLRGLGGFHANFSDCQVANSACACRLRVTGLQLKLG